MSFEIKIAELAKEFLDRAGGSLHIIKLMKLLYIAERESLSLYAKPIAGDMYTSMKHGPVLLHTYDMMNGNALPQKQLVWNRFVAARQEHYIISNKASPKTSSLDNFEIEIVDSVWESFKGFDEWEIEQYTHDYFDEWKDPGDRRSTLTRETLLKVLGYSSIEIMTIEDSLCSKTDSCENYHLDKMVNAIESQFITLPSNINTHQELDDFIMAFAELK